MEARNPWHRLLVGVSLTGALAGALGGCAMGVAGPRPTPPEAPPVVATAASTPAPVTSSASSSSVVLGTPTQPTPAAPPSSAPALATPFDVEVALAHVEEIVALGPRDAASRAHASAAAYVAGQLEALGYRVELQGFRVPAGTSWGVRVPAGSSANVVAEPAGFDPGKAHVVLGAHLDTVPQAPGAEDNASGVAVLLELARMLREQPARLPVRLVAFGAEESRGSGASMYAFGSRHYVSDLSLSERRVVHGMVSLDRVGIRAATVPVCFGGRGTRALADALRSASAAVPTKACRNRASDHVSFEAVGIPAARIGSVPYPAYHSARDLPHLLDSRQLARTGSVVWSWLRSID